MLAQSRLQTIVLTAHPDAAEQFYSYVLGLPVRRLSNGNRVYDVGGSDLLLAPVAAFQASTHTVIGFAVDELNTVMDELSRRGIAWARFDGLPQDARGVLETAERDRVAWFRDPDGNILSLVQYSTSIISAADEETPQ